MSQRVARAAACRLNDINWHGRPGSAAYYQDQVDAFMKDKICITRADFKRAWDAHAEDGGPMHYEVADELFGDEGDE